MKADPALFEKVEGDADTLAGLLLEIKGEFPVLHERLDYGNYPVSYTHLVKSGLLRCIFVSGEIYFG